MSNALESITGGLGLYKAYQEFTAPDIDYDILQLSAEQKEIEADNLVLQVEQEANLLREEFIQAVGSAQYGAARRGVKVGVGDVQQNIEESAGAVGKDIQTIRENTEFQAGQLRSKGKRLKTAAKYQKQIGGYQRFAKGVTTLAAPMEKLKKAAPKLLGAM